MPPSLEIAGPIIGPLPPGSGSFLDKLPPELYLQIANLMGSDVRYWSLRDIMSFALTCRAVRGAGQEILHRNINCGSVASLKMWVELKDQYTVNSLSVYLKGDQVATGNEQIAGQALKRARGVTDLYWRIISPLVLIPIEVFSFPNLVSLWLDCCSFSCTPTSTVHLPSLQSLYCMNDAEGTLRELAFVRILLQSTATTLRRVHILAPPADVPLAFIPGNVVKLTVTSSISSTDAARFTSLRDLECEVHSSTLLLAMLSSLPSLLNEFVIVWVGGPGSGDADEMTQCLEMPCLRNLKKVFLCHEKTSMNDVFDGRPLHGFKDECDRRGIRVSASTEAGDDPGDEDEGYRDLTQAHWKFY